MLRRVYHLSRPFLPILLAAAILAGLVLRVDAGAVLDELGRADLYWIPALLATNLVSDGFRAFRWQQLASPMKRPPLPLMFLAAHIGSAVNFVVPLRAGEAIRVRVVSQRTGIEPSSLVATLFGEILSDLVIFSAYIAAGLLLLSEATFLWPAGVIAGVVTIAGLAGGYWLARRAEGWERVAHAEGLRAWAGRELYNFGMGMQSLRNPGTFAKVLIAAQGTWFFEALMFYLSGQALGVDLSFPAYLLLVVAANVVGSVPITQAGFGVFELGVAGVMAALGVDEAQAAAYAIFVHVLLTAPHLVYGPLAALLLRVNLADVLFLGTRKEAGSKETAKRALD